MLGGISSSDTYTYDVANRLASVDGVNYTWDNNGNLLNDGVNEYTYDSANRLIAVSSGQGVESSYTYNGLGDRLSRTVNSVTMNYTLDLNTGLTQVLDESAPQGYGTNTYLYGNGRISQVTDTTTAYFLGDALGSAAGPDDESIWSGHLCADCTVF
jgi:YD repeat-containing protein